ENVNPSNKRNLVELTRQLREFKERFEKAFGLSISDESLWESIRIYNRNRELLSKLYDLRRQNLGLLSGREVLAIVQSAMVMPKDEHSDLLEKLLAELEKRKPATNNNVRLWLSGQLCQPPRVDLLNSIERVGAVIVDDDLYYGYRYFAGNTPLNGDPLEAMAKRYLYMPIFCPTRVDSEQNWGEQLVKRAKESKAQGVIILMANYCEAHAMFYPSVREKLSAAGIPNMMIQTEYETVSLRGEETRVQAFVEMVRMKS
ncbi:2-hydroxyacyl-CoA dehydratase subunit D, partial [Chloroflexota bacterium]